MSSNLTNLALAQVTASNALVDVLIKERSAPAKVVTKATVPPPISARNEDGERTAPLKPDPPPKQGRTRAPSTPDLSAIAAKYADFEPKSEGCLCGCGATTSGSANFSKGHHNRFRAIVAAVDGDRLPFDKIGTHAYAHLAQLDVASEGLRKRCTDILVERAAAAE